MSKINQYKKCIYEYMKGYAGKLISIIVFSNLLIVMFDIILGIIFTYSKGIWMFLRIISFILSILINNIVYFTFIRRIRDESIVFREFTRWDKNIYLQILCGILLNIMQYIINLMFIEANSGNFIFNFIKCIISFIFIMMGFIVALLIYDGSKKPVKVIKKAYEILKSEYVIVIVMSVIYSLYKIIFNDIMVLFMPLRENTEYSINNIIISLFSSGGGKVWIIYIANIFIGAVILSGMFIIWAAIYNKKYNKEKD